MIKSVFVAAAVLALTSLCGCHAQGSYSARRLSAWHQVAAPKEGSTELHQANYSRQEWDVTLAHGHPTAYLLSGGMSHAHLPFRIAFNTERRGDQFAVRVSDGWLVGFNAGEWGGSLWWFSPDGRRRYKVSDDQVISFVQTPMGLLAPEGLAHLTHSDGKIIRLTRTAHGHWQSADFAALGDAPYAAALDTDGSLVVITLRRLVWVLPTGEVRVLLQNGVWSWLYPNSMVRDGAGDFYVGMRRYVVRIKTGPAGIRLDWLLPPKQ